jgi:hypothetical protein
MNENYNFLIYFILFLFIFDLNERKNIYIIGYMPSYIIVGIPLCLNLKHIFIYNLTL